MEKKEKEEKVKGREKSNQNLMPIEEINARRTPEERKEKASIAGKKSGEKRRNNRMMMDLARKMLEMPVGDAYKNHKAIMERFGVPNDEMSYAASILASMIVKAMAGDANAAKYVRDSAGLDSLTVLKEEQMEYMKENGASINLNIDGELTTKSRVQIYLPERDEDPE